MSFPKIPMSLKLGAAMLTVAFGYWVSLGGMVVILQVVIIVFIAAYLLNTQFKITDEIIQKGREETAAMDQELLCTRCLLYYHQHKYELAKARYQICDKNVLRYVVTDVYQGNDGSALWKKIEKELSK